MSSDGSSDDDDEPLVRLVKTNAPTNLERKASLFNAGSGSMTKMTTPRSRPKKDVESSIGSDDDDDDQPLHLAVAKTKKPAAKHAKVEKKTSTPRSSTAKPRSASIKKEPTAKRERSASTRAPAKPRQLFDKEGQRYDTPLPLDCLRLFYESLLNEERAGSPIAKASCLSMAEQWCMERGVLEPDQQASLFKRFARYDPKAAARYRSPTKGKNEAASSRKVKTEIRT